MAYNPNEARNKGKFAKTQGAAGSKTQSFKLPSSGPGSNPSNPVQVVAPSTSPTRDREFEKTLHARTRPISDREKDSLDMWTGGDSDRLREEDKSGKTKYTRPDRAQDVPQLYKALDKLPSYEGVAYRGLYNLSDADLQNITSASHVGMDAVSSFTRHLSIGRDYAEHGNEGHGVLMKFHTKSGKHTEHLSLSAHEGEVTVPKGANFRITSRYWAQHSNGKNKPVMVLEGEEA